MNVVYLITLTCLTLWNFVSVNVAKAQVGTGQTDVILTQPQGHGVPVTFGTTPNAEGLVETILVNTVSILFAVGGLGVVVYFIWGAVDWVLSGGDKEKISSARKKMTNAIIGLVLLSLSYVIINLVGSIVGFNPLGALQIPGLGYTGARPAQGP